jgi:hypothetical protein
MVMVIGPQARAIKPARMAGMIFDLIVSFLVENEMRLKKVPEFYTKVAEERMLKVKA